MAAILNMRSAQK